MSADLLRQAADILRERADKATPGPWSAADEHGLVPEAWPAWCVSQMRPGYESMSPEDGYVKDVADVHGDDKDTCPDAAYIATVHPGVGLALADWLDTTAADFDANTTEDSLECKWCADGCGGHPMATWHEGCDGAIESAHYTDDPCECYAKPLALARLIVGGGA